MSADRYGQRVAQALRALGIDPRLVAARRLRLQHEAQRLAPVGIGTDGRDKFLTPSAARAWLTMSRRAAADGVDLQLISAFRSLEFQSALLRGKLGRGDTLEQVLRVNAPPGYSEHHSGRAVDIGTSGVAPLDESFERTPAFAWLQRSARHHGFVLSYPRDNADGYLYEPWHWCHRPARSR